MYYVHTAWLICLLALSTCGGTTKNEVKTGLASYYADYFHGRTTASGEIYDSSALTAAHRELPFGTRVRVTNLKNQLHTTVVINDRGPFNMNRIIDLSREAATQLEMIQDGVVKVRMEILGTAAQDIP
jgi:rare lipoprotein A